MHIIGSCTCLAEKLGHLFFFPPNRQSHKTRTATRVFRRGRFAVIKSWDESRVCKKGIWACSVCDRAVVHSYALVIRGTIHLNLTKYEKFTIFFYIKRVLCINTIAMLVRIYSNTFNGAVW